MFISCRSLDQSSLVRPYTKWEWTLPCGVTAARISSLREPPDCITKEQADGRFPFLTVCRSCLGVTGSGDHSEFVLTDYDSAISGAP
jgi:hypothetical protein